MWLQSVKTQGTMLAWWLRCCFLSLVNINLTSLEPLQFVEAVNEYWYCVLAGLHRSRYTMMQCREWCSIEDAGFVRDPRLDFLETWGSISAASSYPADACTTDDLQAIEMYPWVRLVQGCYLLPTIHRIKGCLKKRNIIDAVRKSFRLYEQTKIWECWV